MGEIAKLGIDLLRDRIYNKCVTESEVEKCHHGQGVQKQIIRKILDLVSVSMQKQKNVCKSIAIPTGLRGLKRYGAESICFWRKNKNIGPLLYLNGRTVNRYDPNAQGFLHPLGVG